MTAFDSIDCFNEPSKLSFQITEYLEKQNLILEYLKKAHAKIQIALSEDFLDYNDEVIHYYLWSFMFKDLVDAFLAIKNSTLLIF